MAKLVLAILSLAVVQSSSANHVQFEHPVYAAPLELTSPERSNGEQSEEYLRTALVCPSREACVPPARCYNAVAGNASLRPCKTAYQTDGVCCHGNQENSTKLVKKRSLEYDYEHVSHNALSEGRREYANKLKHIGLHSKVMSAKGNSQSMFHQQLQAPEPVAAKDDTNSAYENVFASKSFADTVNMSLEERQQDRFSQLPRQLRKRCLPPVSCDPRARYRSFDGTCNNLTPGRTSWGAAGFPFEKLLPPAYEDGVWAPRLHSVTGRFLPSARTISAALLPDLDRPDHHLNLLLMQYGQFIAHDITRSASVKIGKMEVQCCTPDGSSVLPADQLHFACLPITVSPRDPFYSQFGVRCLNFVRLELATDGECKLGYAKQVSKVTHFVDASTVYGSSKELADSLRTFQGGQLRNSFPVGIEHPPFNRDPRVCEPWAKVCFEAGDDRINQIISLVQVQTLFLREHNRLANLLSHVNPQWNDETLYQEARKIVWAEIQKILYNEYLPIILGWDKATQYGLPDNTHSHTNHYNPDVRPIVFGEASAAAYRFGHSTVQGAFRVQHRNAPTETVPIHTVFDNPSRVLHPDSFDDYMFSLGSQPQQQVDNSVTLGLTGMLFAGMQPFGSDLASLNIQRGRDHGLRPYNDYRAWAGLPRIRNFDELGAYSSKFAQVYESPEDVDLWIGGLLEAPVGEGLVGPTFSHIIGENFARLKYGDRFYYTNGPEVNPGAFTTQQLQELQKTSLASIICANVDKRVDFYQAPHAFFKSSKSNVPIPCEQYPSLNLHAWKH